MKTTNFITLSDGRKLCYTEYGDPKGKPIFYFHGWPDSRLRIHEVSESANEVGVRLVSIDRPGYGYSTFKPKRTLLDWADDVVELADKLKFKKFSIVGVSGGGPYSAAVAYKIPNRIFKSGIVVGLGPTYVPHILDEMSSTINRIGWANYSKFPIMAKLGSIYREIGTKYLDKYISKFDFKSSSDQKVLDGIKENWQIIGREAFRQGHKAAEQDLLLYTSNWGFDLREIKTKMYLWYGEEDQNVTLAMARHYKSKIKNSNLTIYPNEGHLISIIHAKEIFKQLT